MPQADSPASTPWHIWPLHTDRSHAALATVYQHAGHPISGQFLDGGIDCPALADRTQVQFDAGP